ncbi:hypothetical protein GSI_04606 [Ganoderma sinense ZZ0214-1]|uniref:Uncharacterized protein n=1 Tax=Ganoderma sinense ZZ0214-1 TaxID=1077348 RepID=A0A2G8SHB7_9APHY|nr:hypothetical protein GSI_04606 [Ganoderma sinense ZZ0214-1]
MDPMFSPKVQYSIGANESSPVDIPTFLSWNHGDPAVHGFLAKLRSHLLPRIVDVLKQEQISCPDAAHPVPTATATDNRVESQIYIHHDRMYHHKKVCFNYTTHDVRRGQDIINCGTPNHNIMLLSSTTSEDEVNSGGRYLYARVLGAYHVNVVYMGPGMLDYKPRHIDFLWVRWYHVQRAGTTSWKNSELPMVAFPPLASESAFGFVDPSDVLRACHIIPSFARGQVHRDGIGLSSRARDKDDYKAYYVGCFSDGDTLMRYHWGMGIGHIHAHGLADAKSLPPLSLLAEVEVEVEPEADRNAEPTEDHLSDARTGGEEEPNCEDPTTSGDVNDDLDDDNDDDDEDLDDAEMPEIDDDPDDAFYPAFSMSLVREVSSTAARLELNDFSAF